MLGSGSSFTYHLVAFVVVSIWGSTFVSTKMLLLAGLTPAQIFTLRFIIAYVLLLVYSLVMQKSRGKSFLLFSKCWQDEVLMFALGVTGGTLYFLTENSAMNYTTTTNTSLIVSLSPLVASFLISLFFRSFFSSPNHIPLSRLCIFSKIRSLATLPFSIIFS